jgi:hypothetical protein
MNIEEYKAVIVSQDWTYMMSEDNTVYASGSNNMKLVQQHKNDSPEHAKLFLKYYVSVGF